MTEPASAAQPASPRHDALRQEIAGAPSVPALEQIWHRLSEEDQKAYLDLIVARKNELDAAAAQGQSSVSQEGSDSPRAAKSLTQPTTTRRLDEQAEPPGIQDLQYPQPRYARPRLPRNLRHPGLASNRSEDERRVQ